MWEADPGARRGRRQEPGAALTPPPGLPLTLQVAEILHGLFRELPSITFKSTLQTMMKAVSVLGTQHTQETVEVILSLCHPSERYVLVPRTWATESSAHSVPGQAASLGPREPLETSWQGGQRSAGRPEDPKWPPSSPLHPPRAPAHTRAHRPSGLTLGFQAAACGCHEPQQCWARPVTLSGVRVCVSPEPGRLQSILGSTGLSQGHRTLDREQRSLGCSSVSPPSLPRETGPVWIPLCLRAEPLLPTSGGGQALFGVTWRRITAKWEPAPTSGKVSLHSGP